MIGVLINTATVIIGSLVGLAFKKAISKKFTDAVMIALGLCTILIGISGMLKGSNSLVAIISMVLGAIVGTALNIDKGINRLGEFFQRKFKSENGKASIAEGFVTAGLLFCVGAMTIVGSLEAGIEGNNSTLITKSILDLISSTMLSAALGVGVLLSAAFVFVFQGGLVLLSSFLEPVLTETAIAELTCVGSILIFALGLNLIGLSKFKVANYLPSLLFAPFVVWGMELLSKWIPALS